MDHFLWFVIRSSKTVEAWVTCLWLRITAVTVLNEDRWHLIEKHQTHKLTPLTSSLIHVWLPHFGSRNTPSLSPCFSLSQTSGYCVSAAALKWVDTEAAGSAKSQQGQTPSPPQKQWSQSPGISMWAISSQRSLHIICLASQEPTAWLWQGWENKTWAVGPIYWGCGGFIWSLNYLDIPSKMVPKRCKRTFNLTFMIGLSVFTNIIQVWHNKVRSDIMFIHLSN